ncbi:MAG: hypothetical protein ABI239_01385 [Aquihabitans sp.]
MLDRLRATDANTRWLMAVVAVLAVVAVPFLVSGPGNDLDVANTFRSGRSIARHGTYLPSRAPGAPVHESLVGILDLAAGPLATNLASLLVAIALLIGLDRLLAGEGLGRSRRWAVALVAANPWFIIAATSTVDYLFALAFVIWAAVALRRGHPVVAGLLAAAAMGSRVTTAVMVLALLVAELTEPTRVGTSSDQPDAEDDLDDGRPAAVPRRRSTTLVVVTAAVASVATLVLFIPSIVEAGGLAFAQNDFSTASPLVHLGRAAVKDLTLLGPITWLVVLLAVPAVFAALRHWRTSWLVRFSIPALILSQVLFVRFPWKISHLLPCLVLGAILLAVALRDRSQLLIALVVLQVIFGLVQVQVVEPNSPNQATGGRVALAVDWGPLVIDWRCRQDHHDAYLGRQKVEVEAAWTCAQPFGQ